MDFQSLATIASHKVIPLTSALVGFGLLIGIHEFGHFIFCKLFGIHTPTFSIGFGPELFARKIGDTHFRLALIPFGGYCEIAGHAEVAQGSQAHAHEKGSRSFADKPYWQKFFVLCGGILFNILFAYLVFIGLLWVGPKKDARPIITNIVQGSAAETIGLRPGDQLVRMTLPSQEGVVAYNQEEQSNDLEAQQTMISVIQKHPGQTISLQIIRDNAREPLTLQGALGSVSQQDTTIGQLGAGFAFPMPKLPFLLACASGIKLTHQWLINIAYGFVSLVSKRLDGAGGPLMIMSQTFNSAQHGLGAFLLILAIISLNLAVLNILPIGILDGGQLLFVTIEAIIRRPLPTALRVGINIASFLLFVSLALYLTYKDIGTLFGTQLKALYQRALSLFH